MIIRNLKLKNFRNYNYLDIDLDEKVNILYGNNAQGKTNILEAIYMLATTRSHRKAKDRDIIKLDEEEAFIKTKIFDGYTNINIDINIKKNKTKGIAINNIPQAKSKELIGIINVVLFSPEDLSIIKSSPLNRRNFIDRELCQINKFYMNNLYEYKKILEHRNSILKENNIDYNLLDAIDEQYVSHAKEIIKNRSKFISDINQIAKNIYASISNNKENLEIIYDTELNTENIEKKLKDSRKRDIFSRNSNVGPHRDDIIFHINGNDARIFGSQGQQRTIALSLKLSEIELLKKIFNKKPVLLLDDVMSELDKTRQKLLLDFVSENQTIITCTGVEEFIENNFEMNNILKVVNGSVSKITKEEI